MEKNNNYVNILMESLQKKIEILNEIIKLNEEQKAIITKEKLDMDRLDDNIRDKGELIDRLNMLDDGFQTVFERVQDELTTNREQYHDEILKMQSYIKKITEQSMTIKAVEQRNKVEMEKQFNTVRSNIKKSRTSNRAASDYYKGMSGIGQQVEPQFMDSKK